MWCVANSQDGVVIKICFPKICAILLLQILRDFAKGIRGELKWWPKGILAWDQYFRLSQMGSFDLLGQILQDMAISVWLELHFDIVTWSKRIVAAQVNSMYMFPML